MLIFMPGFTCNLHRLAAGIIMVEICVFNGRLPSAICAIQVAEGM